MCITCNLIIVLSNPCTRSGNKDIQLTKQNNSFIPALSEENFFKLMYIIQGIGNNYIVKLNNKLLNLPHLKDLYKIEVFNFMFKFILLIKKYNKVQSNLYWVKYVKTFI